LSRRPAVREAGSLVPVLRELSFSILAAILSLVPLGGGALAADRETPSPPPAFRGGEGVRPAEPGMIAPDFTVLDVEGHPFRLAEEVSRKPVLLLFWSVFCEPCRGELSSLQKAQDRYAGRDVTVVAVAVDGEPLRNTIAGFARQEGYTFKILVDELDSMESWKVADAYGVAVTPTLLLLEKGGKVSLRKGGKIREDELDKAVSSLLKK
jgi:peroxiredoxin